MCGGYQIITLEAQYTRPGLVTCVCLGARESLGAFLIIFPVDLGAVFSLLDFFPYSILSFDRQNVGISSVDWRMDSAQACARAPVHGVTKSS